MGKQEEIVQNQFVGEKLIKMNLKHILKFKWQHLVFMNVLIIVNDQFIQNQNFKINLIMHQLHIMEILLNSILKKLIISYQLEIIISQIEHRSQISKLSIKNSRNSFFFKS